MLYMVQKVMALLQQRQNLQLVLALLLLQVFFSQLQIKLAFQ
jgi:hypothetical protein